MSLSSCAQVDIVSKECRPRNCTLAAVSYEDLVYMEKIGVRNYRRAVSISHLHAQLTSITCTCDTHKHTRTHALVNMQAKRSWVVLEACQVRTREATMAYGRVCVDGMKPSSAAAVCLFVCAIQYIHTFCIMPVYSHVCWLDRVRRRDIAAAGVLQVWGEIARFPIYGHQWRGQFGLERAPAGWDGAGV
jgi:hypothetical protein